MAFLPLAGGMAQSNARSTIIVRVVASSVPDGAKSTVLLRRDLEPRNIVLIDSMTASGADLALALETVRLLREKYGDSLSTDMRVVTRPRGIGVGRDTVKPEHALDSSLRRLRDGPASVEVPGIGIVKAMDFVIRRKKRLQN